MYRNIDQRIRFSQLKLWAKFQSYCLLTTHTQKSPTFMNLRVQHFMNIILRCLKLATQ